MVEHHLFYSSFEEAQKVAVWIEENFLGAEDVRMHKAYDGVLEMVIFGTTRVLDELGQSVLVYRPGLLPLFFSFNQKMSD